MKNKIAIIIKNKKSRDLIYEFLKKWQYELHTPEVVPTSPSEYGVIIIDDYTLQNNKTRLKKLKIQSSIFLPVLLAGKKLNIQYLTDDFREFFDEIIYTPIEEKELQVRLENLINMKKLSDDEENIYQTVFENTGTAVLIVEEDTTIILVNKQFEKLSGYKKNEIEGRKSWTEFVSEKDLDRMKKYHRDRRKDPDLAPRQYEFDFICRDGKIFNALMTVGVIPGTKMSVGSILDITQQKETEKELEREKRFLAHLASSSPIGILRLNKKGKVIFANYKAESILGRKEKELANIPIDDEKYKLTDFDGNPITTDEHPFYKVKEKGEALENVHIAVDRPDGERALLSANVTPIYDNEGKFDGVVAVIQDISDQIQLEEKYRRAQKLDSIGKLAGGVAHDFNNLLTAIIGNAQIAEMKIERDSPIRDKLGQINKAANRAARLTDQLLLFSRKKTTETRPLDLNIVIRDMLKMLNRLISENIKIKTDLTSNPGTIEGDEGNLEQVIMNLVINARDAMAEGGTITIATRNREISQKEAQQIPEGNAGNYVLLQIEDTGKGIEKEIINKIFDPFFTTKKEEEGTGLGLSVVYGIVKKHKGWINVYSEQGKGTIFKLYFPAVSQETKKSKVEEVDLESLEGNGENILFIEDDQNVLDYGTSLLKTNNYHPFPAQNAAEALTEFNKNSRKYDLIISDIVLPDKNGLRLIEEINEIRQNIPIIMSSGYTKELNKYSSILGREVPFIRKPYSVKDMLLKIKKVLNT